MTIYQEEMQRKAQRYGYSNGGSARTKTADCSLR